MSSDERGHNQILSSIARMSSAWVESVRAISNITDQIRTTALAIPRIEFPKFELPESLKEVLRAASIEDANCKRLESAGWTPHATSPWHLAKNESLDPDQLKRAVEHYYSSEWDKVGSLFVKNVDQYDIDDEAKATFGEAISAHGLGLYRCAPRVLFPEIERVSRVEIHQGQNKIITSQQDLQNLIGRMTPAEMAPLGMAGFRFYMKLTHHVYLRTDELSDSALTDPVPNRHVALHGLAPYSTAQNSLNAIIFADYIFKAISKIKKWQNL